jgi:hypothetical protein
VKVIKLMKYIAFSFDDSREDTYTVVYKIMKKYGIKATVNVITEFVNEPEKFGGFVSNKNPMTVEQLLEWQNDGNEIACHGHTHKNTAQDVKLNIYNLKKMGLDTENIGFASPNSYLTEENIKDTGIGKLYNDGTISYIRSGIQIKREGLLYIFVSIIEQLTHSKELFYKLNSKNKILVDSLNVSQKIIPSVAIKDYTTVSQVEYFIDKLKDNEAVILMFHSILYRGSEGYGKDHYYWDADKFEKLCADLTNVSGIQIITTHKLFRK